MRVDLVVPNEGAFALEAVRSCALFEEMGYDGLWFTDHVVGFEKFKPVYGPYWLEALSSLSHAAATTKRVRLGVGVLVVPYRDAVYAAKALATIDVLSEGRIDLGVGTGWSRAEFFALGRQDVFERRGAYTDEALEVMQRCWRAEGEIGHEGRFLRFRKVQFEPRPVQQPRIPLWVGARGTSPAALRRTARFADVWHPTGMTPAEVRDGSARLDDLAGRRIPMSIRTRAPEGSSATQIVDLLGAYEEAGCIQAAVDLRANSFAALVDGAEKLIEAGAALRDGS